MGREIRRVPANWEHPKDKAGEYIPMYDKDYESVAQEWVNNCIAWENGTSEKSKQHKTEYPYYWEWDMPPDKDSYRPKFESEPTWYQVYETVSEGTPTTPPFASKEELVTYLVEHGDFWDQQRGDGGWNRQAAEQFVEREWAPSLVVFHTQQGNIIHAPRDGDIIENEQ